MPKMPVFDWEQGEFLVDSQRNVVTVEDGPEAIEQIVIKAQQTPRGAFLIYASEDSDADHKYGSDAKIILAADISRESRVVELQYAVRESLIYDPRIKDVTDVTVIKSDTDYADISCTVSHIYGRKKIQGVNT